MAKTHRCIRAPRANARVGTLDEAENTVTRHMSEGEVSLWLAAATRHRSRLVAYLRCVSRELAEVADLLAETVANEWCARDTNRGSPPEELELLARARSAAARWMATHRREVSLDEVAGGGAATTPGRPGSPDLSPGGGPF